MAKFQRKSTEQLGDQAEQTQQPKPIEAPDPFDLKALRRDPQEGLVKAKKLLLEIPVVGRPDDTAWFRVHAKLEFPTRAIDLGRKDYYLVKPELQAHLDRFLKPVVLHIILVRPDEVRLWVRREKGPEDNDNSWWASAQTIAEQGKGRWLQIQPGSDHYVVNFPEGEFSDPVWPPDLTMESAVRIGFRNRLIDSREHPAAKRLLGI